MYSREIDGKVLTLSASAWTYRMTFILYDYETESMWYHFEGQEGLTGISGVYADRWLPEFESTKTRWVDWWNNYPQSKFLRYP